MECATTYKQVESKVQSILFTENGNVAYQMKENDTYSNMQEINLSLHIPSTSRMGSKTFFFSKGSHDAYQVKEMKRTITCKQ